MTFINQRDVGQNKIYKKIVYWKMKKWKSKRFNGISCSPLKKWINVQSKYKWSAAGLWVGPWMCGNELP